MELTPEQLQAFEAYISASRDITAQIDRLQLKMQYERQAFVEALNLKPGVPVRFRGRDYLIFGIEFSQSSSGFCLHLTKPKKDGSLPSIKKDGTFCFELSDLEFIND